MNRTSPLPLIRFAFPILVALFVLCSTSSAQEFKTVHDGVEYAQVDYKIGSDPVKINLLRLDLKKVRLDVHHAMDAAIGTEKTSSIATRHGAVAAINAGFFRLDTSIFAGDPVGLLIIDGELLSESSNNRVAIGISNNSKFTDVWFGHETRSRQIKIEKEEFDVAGINRARKDNELVIYFPAFHRTTLTSPDGIEIVVRNGRITEIQNGHGSSPIPSNGYILSASGSVRDVLVKSKSFRVGAKVTAEEMVARSSDAPEPFPELNVEDAVAGVPQLVKNGKIDITWEEEKSSKSFVETRHPRTAVAKLKDGKFLMITVDGRQPGVSVGMNLYELADYLLSLGAVDAMNLDGGGSTTMFLDGKVVNKPSDKEGERKVSDAILVTLRKGKAARN